MKDEFEKKGTVKITTGEVSSASLSSATSDLPPGASIILDDQGGVELKSPSWGLKNFTSSLNLDNTSDVLKIDGGHSNLITTKVQGGIGSLFNSGTSAPKRIEKAYPEEKLDRIKDQFDRVIEYFGSDPDKPDEVKDGVFRKIAEDVESNTSIAINWRTLKAFYVSTENKAKKELNYSSLEKIYNAFNYVTLSHVPDFFVLYEALRNKSDHAFFEPYFPPKVRINSYKDELIHAMTSLEDLWKTYKNKDDLEGIVHEVNFEASFQETADDLYSECFENKIDIYHSMLPSSFQPPKSLEYSDNLKISWYILIPRGEEQIPIMRSLNWSRRLASRRI
tara:strand:- start:102 stop:1106 length:1005 start_codon:yes stop_codon:yes gene_type:complete